MLTGKQIIKAARLLSQVNGRGYSSSLPKKEEPKEGDLEKRITTVKIGMTDEQGFYVEYRTKDPEKGLIVIKRVYNH